MMTIVPVDEEILEKAARLSGIRDKTALVHKSLGSLIAGESSKRLAALGGTEKGLGAVARRGGEADETIQESDSGAKPHFSADKGGPLTDGSGNGR